jgi:hypothetical protein
MNARGMILKITQSTLLLLRDRYSLLQLLLQQHLHR